ncbi:MAG TPA: hypothetical protein V6C91_03360, partial [Coleofasciculaceae cyanobacterium]
MSEPNRLKEVAAVNQRSLSTLSRAITLSEGNFALILVRCNYEACKEQMWEKLVTLTGVPLSPLVLRKSVKTLYTPIMAALADMPASALIVFGLESVQAIDQVLIATNQVRDEFRKSLIVPLVLWVTDEVLQKLTRFAPDFKSWAATSIKFELANEQLLVLWNQTADELFAKILSSDLSEFLPNKALNLAPSCRRRQEIESSLRDLKSRNVRLEPGQCATWQFILGRDAFDRDQIDVALQRYQQSLNFWQQELGEPLNVGRLNVGKWLACDQNSYEDVAQVQPLEENLQPHNLPLPFGNPYGERGTLREQPSTQSLERLGVLLHHIGLCYCRQAELQQLTCRIKWEQAKESFRAAIEIFTLVGHLDLVAQLTILLGEVLRHLEHWTELQALALHSLEQPPIQNNPVRLAQAYGYLAAVAYAQTYWEDTKYLALAALDILNRFSLPQPQHRGCYLLLSAKAQRQLGELSCAMSNLEQALKAEAMVPNSLRQHPQLYISLLEELRSLYLEQQQYIEAFQLKQQQRSVEQQYGFCTFLGAAPLQPFSRQGRGISSLEIAAAGRQADVNRLIERLSRNDHKLTIVHGSSGVGKTSLINAGLVPALKSRVIGARETVPIVQKAYTDWMVELERRLDKALTSRQVEPLNKERLELEWDSEHEQFLPEGYRECSAQTDAFNLNVAEEGSPETNTSLALALSISLAQAQSPIPSFQPFISNPRLQKILKQLRLGAERKLLMVLVFDQFEEFFFACTKLEQRREFYEFLAQCLNLPFVKVILSLREDYLHYLLECERYCNLNTINNNILDRQLRYHLGDLSPDEARNVISTLAAVSQFQLEESLISALVRDLAGSAGVVRLIELQVVGQQLQAEKITTLEQYYGLGIDPKATLVERSLLTVIRDCGEENEDTVWQILFSLTDERGTRPLKTQAELGLGQGNSLIQNPDGNTEANALRVTDSEGIASLKLRSLPLRGRSISRLTRVRLQFPHLAPAKFNIKTDRGIPAPSRSPTTDRPSQIDLILKILVGSGLVFRVPEAQQERYQLVHDYLVEPIRQKYKQRNQFNVLARLERSEQALTRARKQRLRAMALGITMTVLAITAGGLGWRTEMQRRHAAVLSLNAQLSAISTSSEALFVSNKKFDALLEGLRAARRLKELEIAGLSSSVEPDTRLQAIAALDQAVYGTSEHNRLEGHQDVVWSVTFSPDGQLIASASRDKSVKLWHPDGTLVTTFKGHSDSVSSVAFSPNGQFIASSSLDGTLRLWRRDGKAVRVLRGHIGHVYSVSFSPNGKLIVSAGSNGSLQFWTVEGKLIKTIRGHDSAVTCVNFSPDGQLIASASRDKTIKLWTIQGKLLQTLKGHSGLVNCVAFSPNSQLVASASDDKTVKLWNRSGILLKTFPKHNGLVLKVAFSADGQRLASASTDNVVRIWSRNGALLQTFTAHSDQVTAVSFSPAFRIYGQEKTMDGRQLTADNLLLASASFDKTIKLWSLHKPSRLILQDQYDIRDVAFSPDSQLIATAGDGRTVKLWNRTGKLLHVLKGHTDRIDSVRFSPDSQLIASASRDGTVKLWTKSGTLVKTLTGHKGWVLSLSFSPDSQRLASASQDGTVKLWTTRGTLIKTLTAGCDSLPSPTATKLAGTGKELCQKATQPARVNAVTFSPDGQLIASA